MPLYEYQCKAGHVMEVTSAIDRRPYSVRCNRCKSRRYATRVLSATPGVVKSPAVPRRSRG